MRVKETIEIARSPEQVWAFVADHANDPRWCKKVKSVEPAGPQRWRVAHKPVPLRPRVTLMVEQVELDPPRRLKLREEDDASVFDIEYQLEGTGRQIRFTQISDFEWKRLPRFLQRSFARGVQRDVCHQLRELKRVLEAT
jgi:uncharacterized protein YndB with AHSA1/START domain